MFLKSILIFLTILIITKSWAYLAFDTKAISEEKPKDPIDLIPIKCGVECLLKCLNENSHFEYGCFDKCSIACTIPRVTDKNLGFESKILKCCRHWSNKSTTPEPAFPKIYHVSKQ